MAENSPIEWTDHTWSPWEGCQKVGPGCDHCYAEGMNRWLRKGENWGPGAPRREYSDAHWQKPLRWDAAAAKAGKRVRVFPSVCDPFDNAVSNTLRAKFLALIYRTPHIDWLLLTKRIGNVPALMEECTEPGKQWVLPPNVWLGATVVNQEEADRDIPKLLATSARVRFLSMEPLLGPVDLTRIEVPRSVGVEVFSALEFDGDADDEPELGTATLDWVIAGGESGHGARPAHPDWFRSLRDQCAAAGVPFLFKQWGEFLPASADEADPTIADVPDSRLFWSDGEKWDRFDGQRAGVDLVARVGKKAAGRLLDGVTHEGFPTQGTA